MYSHLQKFKTTLQFLVFVLQKDNYTKYSNCLCLLKQSKEITSDFMIDYRYSILSVSPFIVNNSLDSSWHAADELLTILIGEFPAPYLLNAFF